MKIEDVKLIVDDLRRGVPCGKVVGHGQSCESNYLCQQCSDQIRAADNLERLFDSE